MKDSIRQYRKRVWLWLTLFPRWHEPLSHKMERELLLGRAPRAKRRRLARMLRRTKGLELKLKAVRTHAD